MGIKDNARQAITEIENLLGDSIPAEKSDAISKVIEKAMIDSIKRTHKSGTEAINHCCSADQDLAHKIRGELELSKQLIITNLSGLR